MGLQAVVFDLDGVLIDSEPVMRFAFQESYNLVVGDGPAPLEDFLSLMGRGFSEILDELSLPREMQPVYETICTRHVEEVALVPGTVEFLVRIGSISLGMAVLTGKNRVRTHCILRRFRLGRFMQVVLTSDDVLRCKPYPDGILQIATRLRTATDQLLMVGDSVNDIRCAQSAGAKAAAVSWGIRPELLKTGCKPDYTVDDWDELYELLVHLAAR